MKKTVSILVSILLVISAIFTVPMVFADNTATSITNTFDEAGWAPADSNLSIATPEGANGNALKINGIDNNAVRYHKIYNPEKVSGQYVDYKPAAKTTYKLTFRYLTRSLENDININVRGVSGGNIGDVIVRAVNVKKCLNLTAYKWDNAVAYFTTPDAALDALAISVELSGATAVADYNVTIDDVKLETVTSNFVLGNTFDEDGVNVNTINLGKDTGTYIDGAYNANETGYNTNSKNSGNASPLRTDSTLGFRAARIASHANKTHFEIYDYSKGLGTDGKLQSFVPKNDSTYTITFDYKIARSGTQSLSINVRPITVDGDNRVLGDIVAIAVDIPKNDANHPTPAVWKTATVNVPITEDVAGLAITVETTGNVTTYTFFDNLSVSEVVSEKEDEEEKIITITNTFDEADWTPADANLALATPDGANGNALQINGIADNAVRYHKIYNPEKVSGQYADYKPTAKTTYKLTFRYLTRSLENDININVRGVSGGNIGDVIVRAVNVKKCLNLTAYKWDNAVAYFTTPDAALDALAISVELSGATAVADYNVTIDDVKLETVTSNFVLGNTFDEDGVNVNTINLGKDTGTYIDGAYNANETGYNTNSKNSGNASPLRTDSTLGFRAARIASHANKTHFEIYDYSKGLGTDGKLQSFVPKNDSTYTITFDYKIARSGTQSLGISVRPITLDGENRVLGDIITKAVDIPKNDANHPSPAVWKTATVNVPITEDIAGLAITIETTGNVTAYTFFDNLSVSEVVSENEEEEEEEDEYITNTYEEEGLGSVSNGSGSSKLKGKNIYHLGTKTAAAREGRVLQFKSITGQTNVAAGKITHVELYNPKDANFASFKPEKDKTYEITFDYKAKAGQTANIYFNIRGVKDGSLGDILATAVNIQPKDPAYADYTWGTATVYVTITEELSALAITSEISTAADAGTLYPYLDNIKFKKFTLTNEFKNTYEEEGLGSISNGGSGSHKLKGKYIFHLGTKTAAAREGRVLQFSTISGQNNVAKDNITHVELYNPYDASFESVKPQKNTTYKIKFDYKVKAGTSGDISFNIRGVNADGIGDILATAVTIAKGDPVYADYTWGTATVFAKTGSEDLSALAISIETSIANNAAFYPYLDNIAVSVVPEGNTTLTCHNFDSPQLVLPNTTLFEDIPVELGGGKKFEGWYLDADYKTPATDNVYGHTEVWAKWRTEGDIIKNTYDDEGVYFGIDENGYITRYSDAELTNKMDSSLAYSYFAKGALATDTAYGNAIQLTDGAIITNTNPGLVRIYDNTKADKALYVPRSNTVYKISFDIKSTALLDYDTHIAVKAHNNLGTSFGKGEFLNYIYTVRDGVSINDWTKVEGYITVPDAKFDFLGISLATTRNTANVNGAQVWIDNIVLTEVMDVNYLTVNPENGGKSVNIPFVAGEKLATIPQVKKEGNVFAGWFTDTAKTIPFTYDKMPAQNLKIYAKWTAAAQNAEDFYTGFEAGDFNSGVTPYTNTGANNKYTNNMSAHASVITDVGEAYDGDKYLHFALETNSSKQTMDMASIAVINPDGTNYQVKSGERYRFKLALRSDYDCYIVPVVTEQVPTGKLNFNNSTEISRIYYRYSIYHSADTWGEMEAYFTPNVSGKVSFLVYLAGATYFDIDNVSIKVMDSSEASLVRFYNEAGNSVKSKVLGGVGEWLFAPVPTAKEGYVFDGWYDKEGNQYIKSVFPSGDLDLYPRYREAEDLSNPETLKDGTLTVDFEANSGNAQAFYQSNKNSLIDNKDAIFVTGDPDGAHSGGNYLKFNNAGQWTKSLYRRFRLYDDNSVGNRVYLEPYSVYKVGFWMKVDKTKAAKLLLATFDNTDAMQIISDQAVVSLTEAESESIYGEWIYYEGDITTGEEISTLGFMLSGGFTTASIDDVTVRKLKMMTVSFESNGGSEVAPIETLEGQYIVAPVEPEKEGYIFDGWYSDTKLKNLFEFNETLINENIKLYAKWTEIPKQEYKEVTTYITEEITEELEIEDPHLDDKLNVLENDTIGENKPTVQEEPVEQSNNIWLIVIIAGSVVVLVAVALLIIFMLKKRKKNLN